MTTGGERGGGVAPPRTAGWTIAPLLLVFAVLLPLAALPILTTAHPPLFDYPNHLSRAHVLAHLADPAPFGGWFVYEGYFIPNVGTDLLLVKLSPWTGTETAGRILLLLIAAGTLGGAVALGRVVAGRFEPWPAFAGVFLLGEMLHWGFLNYLLGVALTLCGLAAVVAAKRRPARLVVTAGVAVVILFCHLVAFGLFAVGVAALELAAALSTPRPDGTAMRAALLRRAAWVAVALLPAITLHLAATGTARLPFAPLFNPTLFEKLAPFTRVLSAGDPWTDAAVTVAVAVFLGGLAVGRRIGLDRRLLFVVAGFLACQIALPYSIMQSFFVDNRIAVATVFVLLAGLKTRDAAVETVGWAVLVLLVAARTLFVTELWWRAEAETAEILASFERIAPGSVFLPATTVPFEYGTGWFHTRGVNPPHEHTASWATIREGAIVPSIFAKRGQNPLVFAPASATLRRIALGPIGRAMDRFDRLQLTRNAVAVRAELDRTRRAATTVYVVVFGTTCAGLDLTARLKPLACGRDHVLLEARRPCPGPAGPAWCGNTDGPPVSTGRDGDGRPSPAAAPAG